MHETRDTVSQAARGVAGDQSGRFALLHFAADGSIWAQRGLTGEWVSLSGLLHNSEAPDEAMEAALAQLYPECSPHLRDTLVSVAHMAGPLLGGAGAAPE
jgi:hypothetical protein